MNKLGAAPEILTPTARVIWEDLAPHIEAAGLPVGRVELAFYAQAVADFVDVSKEIHNQGLEGEPGELDVNPTVHVAAWLTDRGLDLAQRLGFTPAARMREQVRGNVTPEDLTGDARMLFDGLSRRLRTGGDIPDYEALAEYSAAWVRWRSASDELIACWRQIQDMFEEDLSSEQFYRSLFVGEEKSNG